MKATGMPHSSLLCGYIVLYCLIVIILINKIDAVKKKRTYHRLVKLCMGSQVTKILGFHEKILLGTPLTPGLALF